MNIEEMNKIAQRRTDNAKLNDPSFRVSRGLMAFLSMVNDDWDELIAVVEAASEFRKSMRGEWPADRYDDMCKALDILEKK